MLSYAAFQRAFGYAYIRFTARRSNQIQASHIKSQMLAQQAICHAQQLAKMEYRLAV